MKLTANDLNNLCDIAINAATEAGNMIGEYANQNIVVNHKDSGGSRSSQVVTEVDLKSQEIILKHIIPTCDQYDLGLLAEESEDDGSRFEKDYFWCIDPLDGTLPFTESKPGYAVSIALVSREGESFIGVAYDPLKKVLYHSIKGAGAFYNGVKWDWKPQDDDMDLTIDNGGAVMNVCWILERDVKTSYYVKNPKPQNGGGCLWDYAATTCLFEELGLHVSDVYGKPLKLNQKESFFMNQNGVVFAINSIIAKKFLKQNV